MIKDYIELSVKNLRKNRIRNWLTMLGIFIGIATVISIISLGQGMQKAIESHLSVLGPDKIIVNPKGGLGGIGSSVELTEKDLNIVKKTSGIKKAAGMVFKPVKLESEDQIKYVNLIGISPDDAGDLIKEFSDYKITEGRDFKGGDLHKIILGYYYTQDKKVFSKRLKLRDTIILNDVEFKVIGFLSKIGSPDDDSSVYIPDDSFKELYPETGDKLNIILAKAKEGSDPKKVAKEAKKNLRIYRGLDEGKEDFTIETSDTLFSIFGTIILIVQIVLVGLASISLVVGGIGIMNTMYTAVLERTKEIGIMKAIGATNKSIFLMFLVESGFLGLVGGGVGIIIGIGFAKLVVLIAKEFVGDLIGVYFPPELIIGALIFSFLVGSISGTLPAIQASKLKPVEALRYE